MSDEDTGMYQSAVHQVIKKLLLRCLIQRRGCFIQQQNRRTPQQRTGNGKALCLSFGKPFSASAYGVVQTTGQLHHKIIRACRPQRLLQQLLSRTGIGQKQILPNCPGKHAVSLGHIGKGTAGFRR